MTEELNQLRRPAFWLFLNRLLWFWSLLAWGVLAIVVTVRQPTWLSPVSLASRTWFLAIAVAGAAYLLSFRRRWHRWVGIVANLMLTGGLLAALLESLARHPILTSLIGLPIVLLAFGIPTFLLARGLGSPTPEPAS